MHEHNTNTIILIIQHFNSILYSKEKQHTRIIQQTNGLYQRIIEPDIILIRPNPTEDDTSLEE